MVLVLTVVVGVAASTASAAAGQVRFVSKPPKITQATTATFRVLAPRGTKLRCALDTARPWRCGRRITLHDLKPGRHRLSVRGQRRGRRLKTAVFAWNVVVPPGQPQVERPVPNPDDVAAVPDGRPTLVTAPAVSGSPKVSTSLWATAGLWTGATKVTRRWQRCDAAGTGCTDVPGATAASYPVTSADSDRALRVVETATNGSGAREAASAPTAVVLAPPRNLRQPAISGTPKVGQTLTADLGGWTPPTATLQATWLRCAYNVGAGGACATVGGGPAYVLQPQDATQFMVLLVVADGGAAGSTPAASTSYGPIEP
jgi:hypothetical protein